MSAVVGRIALTYLSVVVGAVIFRASSVSAALALLAGMAGVHGTAIVDVDPKWPVHTVWLAGLYVIIWAAPNTQQIMGEATLSWIRWRPTLPWAVAFGCAVAVGVLSLGGANEFLYFQF